MKITNPIIAPEKLTDYLLMQRPRGDKSGYLQRGGYTEDHAETLRDALIDLAATGDAEESRSDRFGTRYKLPGQLKCPNGRTLGVVTIWMRKADGRFHFIMLVPSGP